MKKLLFSIVALVLVTTLSAQKIRKSYQSAYILNTETASRIAIEQQLNNKSLQIQEFIAKYPVLEDLKNYNSKVKYSLINDALIQTVGYSDDNKYTLFYLKNSQIYKVKNKKRVNTFIAKNPS